MEEKVFMNMYADMFESFQEQTRLFMVAIMEREKNNDGLSSDILDNYKKSLVNMLNTLAKSLDNFKDEKFKNFYKSKVEYNYQYIEDLSSVYQNINMARR